MSEYYLCGLIMFGLVAGTVLLYKVDEIRRKYDNPDYRQD